MKKIRLIIPLMLVMALLVACGTSESLVVKGTQSLAEGNLTQALAYFQEAVAEEEDLDIAWRGIGHIRFQQNDHQGAFDALINSLDHGAEESPIVYNLLGVSAFQLHDFPATVDLLNRGISMMQNDPATWPFDVGGDYRDLLQSMMINRLVATERMANWSRAYSLIEEYLSIFPDDAEAVREREFLRSR